MHSLTVNRKALLSALDLALSVVPTRPTTREAIKNVLLRFAAGVLTVAASDIEMSLSTTLAAECSSPCESLVNPNRLRQILMESTDDDAVLSLGKDAVKVTCGGRYTLQAVLADEFPPVAAFAADDYFTCDGGALRDALTLACGCAAAESTRYALGGILFDVKNNTIVATDSHRLIAASVPLVRTGEPWEANIKKNEFCILSTKAAKAIARCGDGEVDFSMSQNGAVFRSGKTVVTSQFVAGVYPQYPSAFPGSHSSKTDVVAGPLSALIRRSLIITNEESRGCQFAFGDGSITVRGKAANIGESECDMPISLEGDAVTVAIDPRYLATFANHFDASDTITVKLVDRDSGVVMESGPYRYVAMPLASDRA